MNPEREREEYSRWCLMTADRFEGQNRPATALMFRNESLRVGALDARRIESERELVAK